MEASSMSTSKQTVSQVKDILRKLERSIDDARARRLRPGMAVPPQPGLATPRPSAGPASRFGV
jgi:hypothetical protein